MAKTNVSFRYEFQYETKKPRIHAVFKALFRGSTPLSSTNEKESP
nr:MAG TPA: hypothetical protein [Caudoviricetes sp.]